MRYVLLICLGFVALAITACAPRVASGIPRAAGDLLFIGTRNGLTAVDPATGGVQFSSSGYVAMPDWSRLVTSRADGETTRVAVLDSATGEERAVREIPGQFEVAAVSTSGRMVALIEPRPTESGPWLAAGRESTTLVALTPSDGTAPKRFELAGNFEPEAFSSDDRYLYLIEYLPALTPNRYRVGSLDLLTGEIGPLFSRTKAPVVEEMRGIGRTHILSPDRGTLYTLYLKENDHVHARDQVTAGGTGQPNPHVHAFVHVLNLSQGWAFCLDLPMPFGIGPPNAHAIAVSPDGRLLYIADRSSGMLAVADTEKLHVAQVVDVGKDLAAEHGIAGAQVGPQGMIFLTGGADVVSVNAATLTPERRWRIGGASSGLAISPDGWRLYVGLADRVDIFDTATGSRLGRVSFPGVETVRHVGRVPSS